MTIALFHFHVTQIRRSAGQSAIAAAACRSGEKLHSEYCGEDSDYTRKGVVISSKILLPAHALPEYADRESFWNAVEEAGVESIFASQLQVRFSVFRIFSTTRGTAHSNRATPEPTTRFPTRFFPATGSVFSVLSEGLAEL